MRILSYLGAGVAAAVFMLAAGWWRSVQTSPPNLPLRLGQMAFEMTDHRGNRVTPQDLLGSPAMLFLGYTYCPDVCPTTLSDITDWLEALGDTARDMRVVFITVDPSRDTPEAMAEYVSYFDPRVEGWSGTKGNLDRAVAALRARYERVGDDPEEYAMNHTANVFLFRSDGSYATSIDYHEPREFALPKVRRALNEPMK